MLITAQLCKTTHMDWNTEQPFQARAGSGKGGAEQGEQNYTACYFVS